MENLKLDDLKAVRGGILPDPDTINRTREPLPTPPPARWDRLPLPPPATRPIISGIGTQPTEA